MIGDSLEGWTILTHGGTGSVSYESDAAIIREGNSFEVSFSRTFLAPLEPSELVVRLSETSFDTTASGTVRDAFEIAITDTAGIPRTFTVGAGRDAAFNRTEGLPDLVATGARVEGDTVAIDLSNITPGTALTLALRHVNGDADTQSETSISCITLREAASPAPNGVAPAASPDEFGAPDFTRLSDVSGSVAIDHGRTSLHGFADVLQTEIAIRNLGASALGETLLVTIDSISDPAVFAHAPSGSTPDGRPFYRLASAAGTLAFLNPNRVPFTFELGALTDLNRDPSFTSAPPTEIVAGRDFVQAVTATDPDGDPVTYELLAGPTGLFLDPGTGVLNWSTTTDDLGTHSVLIRVRDGRGGSADRAFSIAVRMEIPNRPPVIASTPVVDAQVGVPYTYDLAAFDADGDPLTFSLPTDTAIPILNPGFELPVLTNGDSTGSLVGWVSLGGSDGTYNPSTTHYAGGVAPEGQNVGFSQGGTIAQVLSASLMPSHRYRLDVLVGDPLHRPFPGFVVQLLAGGVVLAEATGPTPANGTFVPVSVTYDAHRNDPHLGQVLEIRLRAVGTQANFDDVRLSSRPLWSVDAGTGQLTWTPTAADLGTHSVTIQARDGRGGLATQTFPIVVAANPTNAPPAFVGTPPAHVPLAPSPGPAVPVDFRDRWEVVQYEFDDSDVVWIPALDGASVRSTINGDPAIYLSDMTLYDDVVEGTFNAGAGFDDDFLGLVFGYQDPDHYYLIDWKAISQNGYGGRGEAGIAVKVVNAPTPLTGFDLWDTFNTLGRVTVLDHQPGRYFQERDYHYRLEVHPGEFRIEIRDGSNDTLVYDRTFQDATFVGRRFGVYTNSQDEVTFKATTRQRLYFGEMRYTAAALDPDGDVVTYRLVAGPAAARFDHTTGEIVWGPTPLDVGSHTFTIEANDGVGGIATQTFVVTVALNRPPMITSSPPSGAAVGSPFDFTVTATDPDGDGLTFLLERGPTAMTIDAATGAIDWTPGAGAFDAEPVTVRVEDGNGGSARQTFVLPVAGGRARPLNGDPVIRSAPPAFAVVGSAYRYDVSADDPDDDALAFDLPLAAEDMVIDPTTGVLAWMPRAEHVGLHNVLVRVRDAAGNVALQSFAVEVRERNSAPEFVTAPPGPATADFPYEYQAVAVDAEADPIAYRLVAAPAGLALDLATGRITWTPTIAQVGVHTVEVVAEDGRGGTAIQTVALEVLAATSNRAPVIASTPRTTARLDSLYQYRIDARDPDGDPLAVTHDGPPGMTVSSNGLLTWTPTTLGPAAVRVTVMDGRGGVAEQTFSITVGSQDANTNPLLVWEPIRQIALGATLAEDVIATDPDGDPFVYELTFGPAGMALDPIRGRLAWTPRPDQVGQHIAGVRITDARGGEAFTSYILSVRGAGVPPTFRTVPLTEAALAIPYVYVAGAVDADGHAVDYAAITAPAGFAIDSTTGLATWTPAADQLGSHTVILRATDPDGLFAEQSFQIVVEASAANRAPSIVSLPPFTASVGQRYTYALQAADPEGQSLRYELRRGPATMTIHPTSGVISYDPTLIDLGPQGVTVAAVDADGAGAVQSFTLTVRRSNGDPVVTSTPPTTVTAGMEYRHDVRITDPNDDPVRYVLRAAPPGMTVSFRFGHLRWATTAADVGTHPVELEVSDSFGGVTTLSFTLTVQPDTTAPRAAILLSENPVDLGTAVTVRVTASDDVRVASLVLAMNGEAVGLDAQGRAVVRPATAGTFTLLATATDASGNVGSFTIDLLVRDPSDTEAPVVLIASPAPAASVTNRIEVVGTVQDDNLASYRILVRSADGVIERVVAEGSATVVNGVLGVFDPTLLENDSYILRLEATDTNGLLSAVEQTIDVRGELKLGNYRQTFTDLAIPVGGIPIVIARTYDTLLADRDGALGFGWRLDFRNANLRTSVAETGLEQYGLYGAFRTGSRVYLTLPGGVREGFTFTPRSRAIFDLVLWTPEFTPDPGVTSRLSVANVQLVINAIGEFQTVNGQPYNPAGEEFGGGYTLVTKDGTTYRLNGFEGQLASVTDRNANRLSFTDRGIESSTGLEVLFERDARGRITAVTDPMGRAIRYEYDAAGNLIASFDREGNVTRYEYLDTPAHYLDRVIDPLGRTGLRMEYDANGRLTRTSNGASEAVRFEYDPANGLQTVFDPLGAATVFEYDSRGNVIGQVDALGGVTRWTVDENNHVTSMTDPLGRTTRFSVDASGNVLAFTDPAGNVIRATYDRFGNVLTSADALGNVGRNRYDSTGNLIESVDPLGAITLIENCGCGRPTAFETATGSRMELDYGAFGAPTLVRDPRGATTTITLDGNGLPTGTTVTAGSITTTTLVVRDASGREVERTDELGGVSRVEYDAAGQVAARIDVLGRRTEFAYDDAGRLVSTRRPDGSVLRQVFDAAGRLAASIDAADRETHFEYDALGRLVATMFPDETSNDWSDNPRRRKEYDAAGQVVAEIDELNGRTEFEYDVAGQRIAIRDALGGESRREYDAAGRTLVEVDAIGVATRFSHDAAGRLIEVRSADGRSTRTTYDAEGRVVATLDESGNETRYEYTASGAPAAVIDAAGARTEHEHDELGRLVATRDALGRVTRFEYDAGGRLVARVLPLGQRFTFEHDLSGRLVRAVDPDGGVVEYEYDLLDRLLVRRTSDGVLDSFTYTAGGEVATMTDASGTSTFSYDSRGRLVSEVNADGRAQDYEHDATGNLLRATTPSGSVRYEYDSLQRMVAAIDVDGATTRYGYDAAGNVVLVELPNGLDESRTYDSRGRLASQETVGAGGAVSRLVYTRGADNRVVRIDELDGGHTEFEYDSVGRLVTEFHHEPNGEIRSIRYDYDLVGNRLERDDSEEGVTSITYDANDRLTESTLLGESTLYAYDGSGRMLARTTGATSATYEWDDLGRMTSATIADGAGVVAVEYEYDAAGRLVLRREAGQETHYLVRGGAIGAQVVEEYAANGATLARHLFGLGAIAEFRGSETAYFLADRLGTTRAVADAQGAIAARFDFDAFGRELARVGIALTDRLYAGDFRDSATGFDRLRFRMLDPNIGRFLSTDPFSGSPIDPASLHRYLYAWNDPANYRDPSGLSPLAELGVVQFLKNLWNLYDGGKKLTVGCTSLKRVEAMATVSFLGVAFVGALFTAKNGSKFAFEIAVPKSFPSTVTKLGLSFGQVVAKGKSDLQIGAALSYSPGGKFGQALGKKPLDFEITYSLTNRSIVSASVAIGGSLPLIELNSCFLDGLLDLLKVELTAKTALSSDKGFSPLAVGLDATLFGAMKFEYELFPNLGTALLNYFGRRK